MLCLLQQDDSLDLYHGALCARRPDGSSLLEHCDYRGYDELLREEVHSWSYMKFPFLASEGPETGWYRVGPLARLHNCRRIPTEAAEAARREFVAAGATQETLAYHWARMIELLFCAETIALLLEDEDLLAGELRREGYRRSSAVGAIEAPRGTLIHHYQVDADGLVTRANLIVSTTHNNTAMNRSITSAAMSAFDGREVSEGMLNRIEVAVRAYDPCLSCATHALGRMPLLVTLCDPGGHRLSQLQRGGDGELFRDIA